MRQIVGETLRRDDVGKDEHWRMQSARLEPALTTAEVECWEEGERKWGHETESGEENEIE